MLKTGIAMPPGQWCTVTLEGVGWELPRNESQAWEWYSLEYEGGCYRTRTGLGRWSAWKVARVVDGVARVLHGP